MRPDACEDAGADIAIILGSGLNALEREAPAESAISYSEFSELPRTSVPGHAGRFVLKQMHGKPIVYAQGRIHLYEGHSAQEVSREKNSRSHSRLR